MTRQITCLPPDQQIGLELTTVNAERVQPLAPWEKDHGSEAIQQFKRQQEIASAAEQRFAGPAAYVTPHWSSKRLDKQDVPRLAAALCAAVTQMVGNGPSGAVLWQWGELRNTPLHEYLQSLRVTWGRPSTPKLWMASGSPGGVSIAAIEQALRGKEAGLPRWSVAVAQRWLLLRLPLVGGALLHDEAKSHYYTSKFHTVYCVDEGHGRFEKLV